MCDNSGLQNFDHLFGRTVDSHKAPITIHAYGSWTASVHYLRKNACRFWNACKTILVYGVYGYGSNSGTLQRVRRWMIRTLTNTPPHILTWFCSQRSLDFSSCIFCALLHRRFLQKSEQRRENCDTNSQMERQQTSAILRSLRMWRATSHVTRFMPKIGCIDKHTDRPHHEL